MGTLNYRNKMKKKGGNKLLFSRRKHRVHKVFRKARREAGGTCVCVCVCVCLLKTLTDRRREPMACWVGSGGGGGGACSSLPAAGSFVVGVPVLLLTLDGAVRGVPAAVVHRLLLTVITLQTRQSVAQLNIYTLGSVQTRTWK